jgi:hypothetical protein
MLGFFSNKSDHPLANIKSAQQLLDPLPLIEPVEALKEVSEWIEALFDEDNAFRLDHQFTVLRLLDEAAQIYLRKVIHAYFAVLPPASFQENRLWGAMNAYYTFTELGYLHLLRGLENGDKGSSGVKPHLALICTRGSYAVFGRLECAAVRYAQIDNSLWVNLSAFYGMAEVEHCQDEILPLYSGLKVQVSVEQLCASVLLWYSVGVGAFKPTDLHISKSLMVHMFHSLVMREHAEADSMFVFDLDNPSTPARVTDEGAMYPDSARFMSLGHHSGQFDDLLKTLDKDLVPDELNLGVSYSAEAVAEVVRRLAAICQSALPIRRHPRRKTKMGVNVLNGFFRVIENTHGGLNLGKAGSESWSVEDMSATGMHCVLPAGYANSIKIGSLIGLQPEKGVHWGAGVVRRLRRDEKNSLHVGVRILANKVLNVAVTDPDGGDDAEQSALLLERAGEEGGESWMLIKPDTFSIIRSPTMAVDGKNYLLLPLALVEKGEDFDLVRYRKMAQESGSAETD